MCIAVTQMILIYHFRDMVVQQQYPPGTFITRHWIFSFLQNSHFTHLKNPSTKYGECGCIRHTRGKKI